MLRPWLFSWLFLPFALTLSGEPFGDEPTRPQKEASDRAHLERLIRQLGSEAFKEREAASRQLEKIGLPAMEALRAAATGSEDAEVRRRTGHVITTIENSLDQLLFDYRSLGLPLPPEGAPLVRYETGGTKEHGLAFLLKPGNDKEPWILQYGTYEWHYTWDPKAQEVRPDLDTVKDEGGGWGGLEFAIQCHARGWVKLAEYLLEQGRRDGGPPPRQELIRAAWYYWEPQLTKPDVDRAPIAKRLKELIDRDEYLDTEANRALLKSLELALVPSKAKPGSIEALIDNLVDYNTDAGVGSIFQVEERCWDIAALGFEAIPALIEHLDDDRLTRARMHGFNNFPGYNLRVYHVVSDLLEALAGQDLSRDSIRPVQGFVVEKEMATKWWNEARRIGEERYLLDHMFDNGRVCDHRLRRILTKYPEHIPILHFLRKTVP